MNQKELIRKLLAWFDVEGRDLPWRRTLDPYAIWVSEIMLQQTQVKAVLPYWNRWMQALPTIMRLARASEERIHKLWEGLGYYSRVRNMQKAAQLIVASHGGRFPEDYRDTLALPGIGPYTAGAISSIAFNQPRPIVDGNIIRVLTRCFGINGDPRKRTVSRRLWRLAERLVLHASRLDVSSSRSFPNHGACSRFNQSLMELGALVCTPRKPQCHRCPITNACVAHKQGRVEDLPHTPQRAPASACRFAAFVVNRGSRFLVRQRPPGVVNAHLWEFPNREVTGKSENLARAARHVLGARPASLHPLCTINHSITRYRITLDVFRALEMPGFPVDPAAGRWLPASRLRRLPFAGAHKTILGHLNRASVSLRSL